MVSRWPNLCAVRVQVQLLHHQHPGRARVTWCACLPGRPCFLGVLVHAEHVLGMQVGKETFGLLFICGKWTYAFCQVRPRISV